MTNLHALKRLTLVVPTYQRQDFICRLMDYWADRGPEVIVLDGSPEAISSNVLSDYPPSIRYYHRPKGIYQRLTEALHLISTDFVVLAGDDEFYIPSALVKCINELDREREMVACSGRAIGFGYKNGSVFGAPQYSSFENYRIDGVNAGERLLHHLREYVPSLTYAVCRTKIWKVAFEYTLKREFPFFAAGELQFEMLMSYAGRSKVISELLWLRSLDENVPTRHTDPSLDPQKNIFEWWTHSANSFEHEEFINIMGEGFAKLSDQSKEPVLHRDFVVQGVEEYLKFLKNYATPNSISNIKYYIRKLISDRHKNSIQNLLKIFWYKNPVPNASLIFFAESLGHSGVRIDFNELKNIKSIIEAFHRGHCRVES